MPTTTVKMVVYNVTDLQSWRIELQNQPQLPVMFAGEKSKNLNVRSEWLREHISASESFLYNLDSNPAQLVEQLRERILNAISDYEDQHFAGLSPQVRISLLSFTQKLDSLLFADNDNRVQQQNYLRLCCFLGDLYSRVAKENENDDFRNYLALLLNSVHVHPSGDLPDHMATGFNVYGYEEIKKANLELFEISEQDLLDKEEEIFEQLMKRLSNSNPAENTQLQQKIANAARVIREEVNRKTDRNEEIDFHFYSRIASNLIDIHNNPADMQAAKRLGAMAEYASGVPSIGKQVAGSLLIALGTVMMMSIAGIPPLLPLLVVTFGVLSIGIVMYGFGCALLELSQRQGLSKGLVDIKKQAENHPEPEPELDEQSSYAFPM